MEQFFKTPIGATSLMVCGLICFLCGGCCLAKEEEKEITPFNLAEFERTGQRPSRDWVEVTDVYVLWPQKKELFTWMEDRRGNKIGNPTVNSIYVPIVSKEAFEKGGNAPARAFVTWRPGEKDRLLNPAGGNELKAKLTGMAFKSLDDTFARDMGLDRDRTMFLHNNVVPAPRSTWINIAIFSFILGVLLVAPFCGKVIGGFKRSRRKPKRRRRRRKDRDSGGVDDFLERGSGEDD